MSLKDGRGTIIMQTRGAQAPGMGYLTNRTGYAWLFWGHRLVQCILYKRYEKVHDPSVRVSFESLDSVKGPGTAAFR